MERETSGFCTSPALGHLQEKRFDWQAGRSYSFQSLVYRDQTLGAQVCRGRIVLCVVGAQVRVVSAPHLFSREPGYLQSHSRFQYCLPAICPQSIALVYNLLVQLSYRDGHLPGKSIISLSLTFLSLAPLLCEHKAI